MNYDAFICYRGDGTGGEFANRLYDELSSVDYLNTFFAPRLVSHGQNFLNTIDEVLENVHVVILILSKNFFENCKDEDDVVRHELKTAAANPNITFLPITFPDFNYGKEDLSCFTPQEINRFKHQSAIPYGGIYDTFIGQKITEELLSLLEHGQSVEKLKIRNKNRYRDASAEKEKEFLKQQTEMLLEYDKDIYENINRPGKIVLDLGCNDGKNTMARFKDVPNVKIIGIDRDRDCINSANDKFSSDSIHFYCADIEDSSFNSFLCKIKEELNIEYFDLINLSMVLLHTENPYRILKTIRPHLSKDGVVFIRDIDDDFNFAFPDTNGIFRHMIDICSYCDILGYRQSGKEIYTYLKRSGFSHVKIEKMGF